MRLRPSNVPATIFVHDNNLAADGDTQFLRGAVSFDIAPRRIDRVEYSKFILRDQFRIGAGGTRRERQFYVVSTDQSVVNAKAAANVQRLH
jgi:hypothetical protein